ncbi:MAG: polyprenyl synthetase family protein [Trueperaceae bacterium]
MFDLIQSDLEAFELQLAQTLRSSVEFIEAIGDDLVGAGGKRLRPSLSFLAGKLLNADPTMTIRVALSVELLHSASLLHDDLIDDADTRRGREAAFRRYGNVVSVMSGDYMLAKMFELLAEANSSELIRLISHTAAAICEGEVLQFQMATLETYSFENYFRVIEGKTAVLLAAALEGVAIVANTTAEERKALREFGMLYGRAFQMQDDYLDLLGDEAKLGKPLGGDLREGKATYSSLVLFDAGIEEAKAIVRRHAKKEEDVRSMIELVQAHGADVEAKNQIVNEARKAIAALELFPDSVAKQHLVELATREIERAK